MVTTVKILLGLALAILNARAYIPAHPTNSSQEATEAGRNVTDSSKLQLSWFPAGMYSQNVAYRVAGPATTGISKGAFVRFSETRVNNATPPTITPWIAFISCDSNSTNASLEEDIFTLARDKGAIAALLVSTYSQSCVINPEYLQTSDAPFDVFSTQSVSSSHLIASQFEQAGSLYKDYDSEQLNKSASDIQKTMQQGIPGVPGYLFAIVEGHPANGTSGPVSNGTGSGAAPAPTSNGAPGPVLTTTMLYAAMGCASVVFGLAIMPGVH